MCQAAQRERLLVRVMTAGERVATRKHSLRQLLYRRAACDGAATESLRYRFGVMFASVSTLSTIQRCVNLDYAQLIPARRQQRFTPQVCLSVVSVPVDLGN